MILKADRIITGDGVTVLENKAVCIDNGKITGIDNLAALVQKYPGFPVKEYKDATILPGLIDMHVHTGYIWSRSDAISFNDFDLAFFALNYAKKAFSKGVTTFRDVSSSKNLCASINRAAKEGFIEVPRIIHTDAALCMTGGHAWEDGSVEVNSPWTIRAAIRDAVKRGAMWIKLMASHRSFIPEFTQEELNAAVDETHRVGKKIAVHAGTQPSIQMCIDAGFDTIEHGTYLTETQAAQMKEKGIVWVPTIAAYTKTHEIIMEAAKNNVAGEAKHFAADEAYFGNAAASYRNNFKKLYDTGVKIVTGTDLCYENAPVTHVAWELKYMVNYGMPAIEAIRAATRAGAETLSIDDKTGEISVGKLADILIVDGNPLEDIGAMERVAEVYFSGKSVYASAC